MSDQSTRTADARPSSAPIKTPRRKGSGKPYNPAGNLGLPTKERLAKSHGFDEVNLAAGDGPKVPRSSEKMPFTPQPMRIRLVAEEIERAARLKKEPNFQRTQTAIDRALEENEFHGLSWYCDAHYRREAGRPAAMRYDDTPRGLIENAEDDTQEKRWRISLHLLEIVDELLPEAYKAYLDTMVWLVYPGFREGVPPSRLEIGQEIAQMKGKDAATGAFVGYTRAVAQAISSARADAIILMKRRKEFRELEVRAERKRNAGMMFKV